jgi:hypothetical protein
MATRKCKKHLNRMNAALAAYGIGWTPYPLYPNSTAISVDQNVWREALSPSLIREYWRLHPDHGLTADGMTYCDICCEYDDGVFHE